MSTTSSIRKISSVLSAFLLAAASAQAQEPGAPESEALAPAVYGASEDAEQPEETGAVYARLRFYEGGLSLRRQDDAAAAQLAVNAPLVPGDQLWTAADGRAEIQLADGSLLRLDREARLSFLNLADREGNIDNTTLVRLLNGSLYVRADDFDPRARRFQVDTPAGSVFLLSDGVYRIDVASNGVTMVATFRGVAEVVAEDVSMMAHSGERLSVEPGRRPTEARAFNTLRRDPFDVWSENRDDSLVALDASRGPRPEVPEPVRPYVSELSRYGDWRFDDTYGWIWIPDDVDDDWRPYYYGHWSAAPIGPVWIGYEPWGWAPYHYGRWDYAVGFGWFWAPGWIYSGAYVSWSIGPSYFGWCPLGYWGSPVYWHTYNPWVYVPYGSIYYHNVHHHYTTWSRYPGGHHDPDGIVLRHHPTLRPGYRPEQVGRTTYRRALSDPRLVRDDVKPGRPPAGAARTSFRGADAQESRRLAARRARPEMPSAGRSLGPASPSGRSPSLGAPRPGVRSPGNGSGRTTVGRPTTVSSRPAVNRPSAGTGRISPATGRPMQPPVRIAPTTRRPVVRPSDTSVEPRGRGLASPSDAQPPRARSRVTAPRDPQTSYGGGSAVRPGRSSSPPNPHVQSGRSAGPTGPRFVMPGRGAATPPRAGVSRSTGAPSRAQPARPAPRAGGGAKGGGKKGGKG